MSETPHIVIAGAGSIGCFVGGCLTLSGHKVSLLGRGETAARVMADGLILSSTDSKSITLPPEKAGMTTDPAILADADMILVAVKSGGTEDMANLIAEHAKVEAQIVSLQNGVTNADKLRAILPGRDVRGGMVPFNVVQLPTGGFHRGTIGDLVVESGPTPIAPILSNTLIGCEETDDIAAVSWGKLLINLNNALNALSGLPLKQQLSDRGWRKVMAAQMTEGLTVLHAAGIEPKPATPIPPKAIPAIMRLPTFLFKIVAANMFKIDDKARSSMWEDLDRGRKTEIDELQGAIVALGDKVGAETPMARAVLAKVKAAEDAGVGSPGITADELLG